MLAPPGSSVSSSHHPMLPFLPGKDVRFPILVRLSRRVPSRLCVPLRASEEEMSPSSLIKLGGLRFVNAPRLAALGDSIGRSYARPVAIDMNPFPRVRPVSRHPVNAGPIKCCCHTPLLSCSGTNEGPCSLLGMPHHTIAGIVLGFSRHNALHIPVQSGMRGVVKFDHAKTVNAVLDGVAKEHILSVSANNPEGVCPFGQLLEVSHLEDLVQYIS
ncbi:hypothetical protein HZ326_27585 [Fusarium oxysporum f. sp. albedinis]|nr:hypothetical protein HZ326_27585 [Fusarium oxysporum f. sp. albedinis]